jgi:ABC-type branched-subunit amino acid transport system substrate-binding protein
MPRPAHHRALAVALALAIGATTAACRASSDEPSAHPASDVPPGQPTPVPGFDGVTITLSELTAATGLDSVVGLPVTAGSRAYFDYVNTELGGIGGKYKLYLDVRDTGGDPARALTAYGQVQPNSVLLAQVLDGPVVEALLPHLRADRVVAAAVGDPADLRDANLLPRGVPVAVEAANGLEWYLQTRPTPGPVCSVVQQGAWGDAGQAGLAFAAAQHHLTLGPEVRVPAPPQSAGGLDTQLAQLRAAKCDAVLLIAGPTSAAAALTQGSLTQSPQWIAVSGSWTTTLATTPIADYLRNHLVVVTEGPTYGTGGVDGSIEVSRIREAYTPETPADTWFTYGFLQAEAVTALLERAVALGDLSRAGILAASRSLGTVSFHGVADPYAYGPPDSRVPPTGSSISRVDPTNPTGLAVTTSRVAAPYATRLLDDPAAR